MAQQTTDGSGSPVMDRLRTEAQGLIGALGDRAAASVRHKVEGATGRLTQYAENGGGPGLMAAMTGARGLAEGKSQKRSLLGAGFAALKEKVKGSLGKGGGGGKKLKVTNIVEAIDVGVPVEFAYNQWTQFADFPSFMKKVESVEQADEIKLNWKAQVLWSHRTWEATIREQEPDDKIVWRSKGTKGYVDGAVTFHELAPNLTRILVVLEYHPQGMFERTGNIWRAQGRRVRLELKHFQRHVMSQALLKPDEVQGWRGVIHDGQVVEDSESNGAQPKKDRADNDRADKDRGTKGRGNGDRRKADRAADDSQDENGRPPARQPRRASGRPASRAGGRAGNGNGDRNGERRRPARRPAAREENA